MNAATQLQLVSRSFTRDGGRDYNEDAVGDTTAYGAVRLFTLADGAGGQGGGDVAAQVAIATARSEFARLPAFSRDTLIRCMNAAHQAIEQRQRSEDRLARMASTFVAAIVDTHLRRVLIGNLGDSRCYVLRGNTIIAQSYDHSLVQRFVDAGLYPADKLRQHPKRNVLYASLGSNPEGVEPFVSEEPIALQEGDGLLLCSDGVWELIDEPTLGYLHAKSSGIEEWRDLLLSAVRGRMAPGHDNFSALVVRCIAAPISDASDHDRTMPPLSVVT
jgi:PPM family protein phosphatase